MKTAREWWASRPVNETDEEMVARYAAIQQDARTELVEALDAAEDALSNADVDGACMVIEAALRPLKETT